MTSEFSSCTRSIGESLSSLDQSPFHTPDVNGCSAPASRAHANTCGSSFEHEIDLVLRLLAAVAVRVHVVGLVPDVPAEHARVLAEGGDNARHVGLEPRILLRILQRLRAGSLQPAGVVHARFRSVLLAEMRIRIPARIEEHEQRLDLVLRGDVEELIDSPLITLGVLLPRQIMQEHPHRRHAEPFGPAELLVDRFRIERLGLPHLELVDRGCRNVVAADQPWLLRVPLVGLRLGPAARWRLRQGERADTADQQCADEA